MTTDEGGPNTISSFKYKLREREDPRVKDRRLQTLLAFIQDNLDRLSPWEAALLYHSLVKLRLPEEKLIEEVAAKCEEHVFQMPPKGVALVAWA